MKKLGITMLILDIICTVLWGIDIMIQFTKDEPSIVITSIYVLLCALWSFKAGMDVRYLWEN